MGAVAWLATDPTWGPAILTGTLFITFITLEFKPSTNNRDTHNPDKQLFEKFLLCMPSKGSIEFVNTQNMAGFSFHIKEIDDLYKFYYEWDDAEHEFNNKKLEKKRNILRKAVGQYLESITSNTFSTEDGRRSVPADWEDEQPERFSKAVAELHSLAQEVVDAHKELIRIAKRQLNT